MKDLINRILEGDFHSGSGSLDFSHEKIELKLYPAQDYESTFQIYGPEGHKTEGYIYTDNLNMELYTQEFAGKESEIAFCYHPKKSLPGDKLEGEFIIISNHGEYSIPYHITIIPKEISSSLGPVKNLFHFTNLAKSNWPEALNLFYSSAFFDLLSGAEKQYITLYRGLSAYGRKNISKNAPKNEHNMEEFLIAIKKKQRVEYLVDNREVKITAPIEPTEYLISITRNGWGFSNLICRIEGDFLVCEKDIIREEDYLANIYKLRYYIAGDKLHAGRNFGGIRLYNNDTEILIPITVTKSDDKIKSPLRRHHEQKKNTYDLMNQYIAFRTKKISQSVWRRETARIIDLMVAADDKDLLPKLYRVQLLITENRMSEAGRMLSRIDTLLKGQELKQPELWCYFIYLTSLENRDTALINRVTFEIERFYQRSRYNWRIGWLLCYLKEEYVNNPAKKWAFLREIVNNKNFSPVIFVEAWQTLKQKPDLLTRLDDFEIHLLIFAAKRKLLNRNLIPQITYLAGKSKIYNKFIFRILAACYDIHASAEVVKAICELLIKGEKIGPAYFFWYQQGIEREIKVTRLYEYYIYSIDQEKEEEIPKQVLLYFSYNSEIDYRYQAYLYAYIHENREEYPDIFGNCYGKIERFVLNQLARGRSGKWLCYLYKHYVTADKINSENAGGLADILFTAQITVEKNNIRDILVLYEKGNTEITYRVSAKVNQIILYGSNYQLFLVDADLNRYAGLENYRLEKWLNPDKIGRMIAPFVNDRIGFDVWLCEQEDDLVAVSRQNVRAYQRLYSIARLKSPYHETVCLNLIRYYFENDETQALDLILKDLKPKDIDIRYHEEVLKIMLARLFYDEAYYWLSETGAQLIDSKLVFRILRYIIPDENLMADTLMLNLAYQSFAAAKYDEKLLLLLLSFYKGSALRLTKIWQAAKSYGLDTYNLSERLLIQILFSGVFIGEQIEIFNDYVAGGGKGDIIKAFTDQCAYDYFTRDKITDVTVIEQMRMVIERNEVLSFICQLAYVKYYAENTNEIDDNIRHHLNWLLQSLIDQNVVFAFFKGFVGVLPLMDRFIDKTLIEYRSRPGIKVMIRYFIGCGGDEENYIEDVMTEMYDGIYVKQFLLFYGESLIYFIGAESGGEVIYGERSSVDAPNVSELLPGCRYNRINEIEEARLKEDYERVDFLINEYQKLDFITNEIFDMSF